MLRQTRLGLGHFSTVALADLCRITKPFSQANTGDSILTQTPASQGVFKTIFPRSPDRSGHKAEQRGGAKVSPLHLHFHPFTFKLNFHYHTITFTITLSHQSWSPTFTFSFSHFPFKVSLPRCHPHLHFPTFTFIFSLSRFHFHTFPSRLASLDVTLTGLEERVTKMEERADVIDEVGDAIMVLESRCFENSVINEVDRGLVRFHNLNFL